MTETTRRQFQQCVNRQRVKQRAQHEGNTTKGAQNFIDNNKHNEEIDEDQCCVMDGDVSAERMQILFTSHNMMKSLIGTDELALCSNGTCKLDSNGCQMTVMDVVGRQQKFHPAVFFHSHGNEATLQ